MNSRIARYIVSLQCIAAWFVASSASGGAPAGDYQLDFTGLEKIWDISGSYSEDIVGAQADYTVNVDSRGKITGSGNASYDEDGDSFDAAITFGGAMSSAAGVTRVRMTLKFEGPAVFSGFDGFIRANFTYRLEVDPATQMMFGTISGSATATIPGLGRHTERLPLTEVEQELLPDMDGNWTVQLNDIVANANRLAGTGLVSLSNGNDLPFVVTGSYAARTDQSRFILRGIGEGAGANLNLTTQAIQDSLNLQNFRGRVLGQNIKTIPILVTSITSSGSGFEEWSIRLRSTPVSSLPTNKSLPK